MSAANDPQDPDFRSGFVVCWRCGLKFSELRILMTLEWSYCGIIASKMPKRSHSARSRIVNLGKYIPKTKKLRRLKVDHDKENVCDASAEWAAKKYRGHRVVPNTILDDLARAMLMNPVSTVLDDDDVGNDAHESPGLDRGNPGVKLFDPHPYPLKPLPL
ncbi:hypothetical protein JOM56_008235 [Amanita muscaria]